MTYGELLAMVERRGHVDRRGAERAVEATMRTLAERLSPDEARQLAAQLPPELLGWLHTETPPARFDVDEFLRRVADREEIDVAAAELHVRAVFDAVRQAISAEELRDLEATLPQDLRPLLLDLDVITDGEFMRRVAKRIGSDVQSARHPSEAVLETLAERITPGDVDDLVAQLPVPLHDPLKRGAARRNEHLDPDGFVREVAAREGADLDDARMHIRAVLAVVREAAGEEYTDITAQLPTRFTPLLPLP
jgi:uncharacterized protein (DUF2267 family)